MTLSERIAANQCAVRLCARARVPDSDCCAADTLAKWRNELHREPDNTYTRRRTLPLRVEWPVAA